MRKLLAFLWIMLLFPAAAWHLSAGQTQEQLDDAAVALRDARECVDAQDWSEAVDQFDAALKALPKDRTREARQIRLEKAKAQMEAKGLPKANKALISLVDELKEDPSADPALLADARSTLANSQYYLTWLMRLEGLDRSEWEPEIEAARQTYKLLVEQAQRSGDTELLTRNQEDLESAIRLARLDLKDLQGLPLPNQ